MNLFCLAIFISTTEYKEISCGYEYSQCAYVSESRNSVILNDPYFCKPASNLKKNKEK